MHCSKLRNKLRALNFSSDKSTITCIPVFLIGLTLCVVLQVEVKVLMVLSFQPKAIRSQLSTDVVKQICLLFDNIYIGHLDISSGTP